MDHRESQLLLEEAIIQVKLVDDSPSKYRRSPTLYTALCLS